MKVLVVHPGISFSVGDVHRGLVKGLQGAGCEVGVLNLDDRLEFYARAEIRGEDGVYKKAFSEEAAMSMAAKGMEAALYEWWPDIVVIVSGFFIPPAMWGLLSKRPHHVVYWCTESPYEDDRQGRAARYADTVILNDPTNLDQFRADINERTFYLPHSYDPDLHHPGSGPRDGFVFVGTGFPSRIEWLEQVDWSGIPVTLAGNWNMVADGSPLEPFLLHQRGLLHRQRRHRRPVPAGQGQPEPVPARSIPKGPTPTVGRSAPVRSSWPPAERSSSVTPAAKATRCSRCCPSSRARERSGSSCVGGLTTTTNGKPPLLPPTLPSKTARSPTPPAASSTSSSRPAPRSPPDPADEPQPGRTCYGKDRRA